MAKKRLDVALTEQGLAESRQKAQAVIMAGSVFVAGQRVDKPGTAVANEADIEVYECQDQKRRNDNQEQHSEPAG